MQNHLIREIDLAHKKSNSFHNGLRQHHSDRIKLAVDWAKHPNVLVSNSLQPYTPRPTVHTELICQDYPAAIAHVSKVVDTIALIADCVSLTGLTTF